MIEYKGWLLRRSAIEDVRLDGFERLDIGDVAQCHASEVNVCVQMVMPFKGDADRQDMRPLRTNARHCQVADEVITAQTGKFVALEWNPSTNSVAAPKI